jgi:hypothetical protein
MDWKSDRAAGNRTRRQSRRRRGRERFSIAAQSAAGLAMGLGLAAALPAEAKVITTRLDPPVTIGINADYNLNLKNSGGPEFGIFLYSYSYSGHSYNYPYIFGTTASSKVYASASEYWKATFLAPGTLISSNSYWSYYGYVYNEPWPGGGPGLAGLKFQDTDGAHYGWVKLEVSQAADSVTILGYAYETEPDKAIAAGDTGMHSIPSLPLLLLSSGAAGVLAYRRLRRDQ